jgi:hypoxanthine phosphoribosyltransferase
MVSTSESTLPKSIQLGDAVLTRRQIAGLVAGLAQQIDAYYMTGEGPLVLVPILLGAYYFCADLSRELLTPHVVLPIQYHSSRSELRHDGSFVGLDNDALQALDEVRGARVLLVDTIVDSGETLIAVGKFLTEYQPGDLTACALIARVTARQPRFTGYVEKTRAFLYGYGLDIDGAHRHLQAIYAR